MPFLKELRALDRYYQRFRIDDHLERFPSALKNLHLAGESTVLLSPATDDFLSSLNKNDHRDLMLCLMSFGNLSFSLRFGSLR